MAESAVPEVVSFIENSVRLRAEHYREQAQHFRSLAGMEPVIQIRRQLIGLADQYDKMAAELDIAR